MSWTLTIYTQVPLTLIELADQLPYHQKVNPYRATWYARLNKQSRSIQSSMKRALGVTGLPGHSCGIPNMPSKSSRTVKDPSNQRTSFA